MIFAGLELMGDVPFRDVIIHSTVLAPDGRRMSKSLGTGIDPLDVIADARRRRDALRAAEDVLDAGRALLVRRDRGGAQAREQALERRRGSILANVGGRDAGRAAARRSRSAGSSRGSTRRSARSRTRSASSTSPHAVDELYHLTFDDFCDWYAEAIKPRLYDGDADARATALAALERLLKLLHPVMPHVTEEIWSTCPARESRLIVAPWPEAGDESRRGRRARRACRRRRRSSGAAACASSSTARSSGSSRPSSSRSAVEGRTATSRPRSSGCARRSRAPRGCSRTSASSANAPAEVVEAEREKLERYRRELDALGG